MTTTWVVVADEAIARILTRPDAGSALQPVQELTDAKAHAKNGELRHDAYGRRAGNRVGTAGRPQSGASTATSGAGLDETHQEAEVFAKAVVRFLTEAQQRGRFDD